ncbi:MAG: hypothetical protein IT423_03215 [Pirellulaceae bacterium]|nr:hypothetical protein [Pirellulaceae bacterium]
MDQVLPSVPANFFSIGFNQLLLTLKFPPISSNVRIFQLLCFLFFSYLLFPSGFFLLDRFPGLLPSGAAQAPRIAVLK